MPRAFGTSCGLQMKIVILVTLEILAPPAASALVRFAITILAWASKSSGGSTLPSTSAPTWPAQNTSTGELCKLAPVFGLFAAGCYQIATECCVHHLSGSIVGAVDQVAIHAKRDRGRAVPQAP